MWVLARGINSLTAPWPDLLPTLDPGAPPTYFVEGNTKNGSDLVLKLKYLLKLDPIRNWVSVLSFIR
jgi:hypothetical protein